MDELSIAFYKEYSISKEDIYILCFRYLNMEIIYIDMECIHVHTS